MMYSKWKRYQADEVLKGSDENGDRLISVFASDYKKVFGTEICPNCNDFASKFQKFLITTKMSKEIKNSGFILKPMYENIPLKFGSSIYVNNKNLTDDYAKELIKNHPRGVELFEVVPKEEVENDEVLKLVSDNNKNVLVKIATDLGIENPTGTKKEIAQLIVDKKSDK